VAVRRLRTARRMADRSSRGVVLVVAVAALTACEIAPHGTATADQARRDFSATAYCPLDRVEAAPVVRVPRAPGPIASDPERMAMWRKAFTTEGDPQARQTIAVSGCGDRATYACWDRVGWEPGRHGRRVVYAGTSCLEEEGDR
jgi:hypothetical protein